MCEKDHQEAKVPPVEPLQEWAKRCWKTMKPFEQWTLILQIITIIVGAGVFWQIREGSDEIENTKYATANSWMLDLDKAFLDKSELRPYFYEGKAIPPSTDREYRPVMAMSEYMLDTFDSFISHRFPRRKRVQPSWKNWMIFCLNNSPALRSYMETNIDWYNSDGAFYDKIYKDWHTNYTNRLAQAAAGRTNGVGDTK